MGRIYVCPDCFIFHCTALQATVMNCTALHCTALNSTSLHYTAHKGISAPASLTLIHALSAGCAQCQTEIQAWPGLGTGLRPCVQRAVGRVYSRCTVSEHAVYILFTVCVQYVYSGCTVCVQCLYRMRTVSVQYVCSVYTVCIQSLCTVCVQSVNSMCKFFVQYV